MKFENADAGRKQAHFKRVENMADAMDGKEPEEQIIAQLKEYEDKALLLLERPDVLHQIKKFLDSRHVGDDEAKILLYVGLCYSLRNRGGLSFAVKSTSSAGKTHLTNSVLELLPSSLIQKLGGSSEKGLIYSIDADAPILFLREFSGVSETANQVLKLSSADGGFEYAVVEKDDNGKLQGTTKKLAARAFITTTTRLALDDELENRCLALSCDESEQQTKAIKNFIASEELRQLENFGTTGKQEKQQSVVHAVSSQLPEGDVFVPYADAVIGLLPNELRARRDTTRMLSIIKAVALLHFRQRPTITTPDKKQAIIALPEDFAMALRISGKALSQTISGLGGRLLQVFEAAKTLDQEGKQITTAGITEKRPDIPANTARPALTVLWERGVIIEDEVNSTKNRRIYRLASHQHTPYADEKRPVLDVFLLVEAALKFHQQHQHERGYTLERWDWNPGDRKYICPLTGERLSIETTLGLTGAGVGGNANATDAQKTLDLRVKPEPENHQHTPYADAMLMPHD